MCLTTIFATEPGGLDILYSPAGILPPGLCVDQMDDAVWAKSIALNLVANIRLARAAIPTLEHGFDPSIVFMASRNLTAHGPGAAAYSAAKAGLVQLMGALVIELARNGITVNTMHPDAVFDTGVWTKDVLERSAQCHGLSVDEHKASNLLKVEISSQDVANAVLVIERFFCVSLPPLF